MIGRSAELTYSTDRRITLDVGTGLAAGMIGKEVLGKVLGPTASYLGELGHDWVKKRVENFRRILEAAERKIPNSPDSTRAVSPRVLKHVLDDGSFCEEPVETEYFGGVLASSKSEGGSDDRGVALTALLARLSKYHLKAHYLIYSALNARLVGQDVKPYVRADLAQQELFVPMDVLYDALGLAGTEPSGTIAVEVLYGLAREDLLADAFRGSAADSLKNEASLFSRKGMLVAPTALGISLFLWAHGRGQEPLTSFFSRVFDAFLPTTPLALSECRLLSELRKNTIDIAGNKATPAV